MTLDVPGGRARAVLEVRGEFDLASGEALARWVDGLDVCVHELVLDLSGLTFIDSSGVRALLQTLERVEQSGRELALVNLQPEVLGVLARLGLLRRLSVLR